MKKIIGALFFFFTTSVFWLEGASSQAVDCSIADEAGKAASRIRQLAIRQDVPCRLRTRAEVESYLRETIQKKIPRERVDREGRVYQMLGLVPLGYKYFDQMIRLYTEQLGGYFDPDLDYYAMADWISKDMQLPIAVHELTHALQDQYFDLNVLVNHKRDSGDTLLARSALAEGDATAVMLDFERIRQGKPSIAEEAAGALLMHPGVALSMSSGAMQKYPAALKSALLFPYVSGFNFVHALLRKGGFAEVNKAFLRPPSSTEEILHPEIYMSGKVSFSVIPVPPVPDRLGRKNETPSFTDTLGEFLISTMLATWIAPTEAAVAASGWAGDTLAYYERADESLGVLVWEVLWDAVKEAEEFQDAFTRAYEIRFAKKATWRDGAFHLNTTSLGEVSFVRTGTRFMLVMGPAPK